MNALKANNKNGVLLTINQTCEKFNIGSTTVRKLAQEAGAIRRIGRIYRINSDILYNYIEKNYSE